MEQEAIRKIVNEVVLYMKDLKEFNLVPVGISARHCHLTQEDLEELFGEGFNLTKKSDLLQPGQFAANETVTIVGPKGSIERVRILGPCRDLTQVEVSLTDSIKLGIKAPLRNSGEIIGSAPFTIVGPKGSVYKIEGLILAKIHIHMSPNDAKNFGVNNGDSVIVEFNGERPVTFGNVLIRVSPHYVLEMHIDTDEANAGLLTNTSMGKILRNE